MKTVEMAEATGALSEYAKQARKDPVVVTQRGKPVAAVVPLGADAWEDFVVSTHPKFLEIIQRSRASYKAHGGIPLGAIEREFGLKPKTGQKGTRKPARKARSSRALRGS